METIGEVYSALKRRLAFTGEAEAEAGAILAHVLGVEIGTLHLRLLKPCDKRAQIEDVLQKRLSGMPLAYALGEKYFYGYRFAVDERVLIPRWDSEVVAERAIAAAKERGYTRALDMCCGSGCLGAALMLESDVEKIVFADISAAALELAQQNVTRLLGESGKKAEAEFVQTDLFDKIESDFDIIICNPPYVSAAEYQTLDAQVREFEPRGALVAERDGYAFYENIAAQAGAHIKAGGALVLEIGSTQGDTVAELLNQNGYKNVTIGRDLAERPRVVYGEK